MIKLKLTGHSFIVYFVLTVLYFVHYLYMYIPFVKFIGGQIIQLV